MKHEYDMNANVRGDAPQCKPEPVIEWTRPGNYYTYEAVGILKEHIMMAYDIGTWYVYAKPTDVNIAFSGRAVDLDTAKICCIACCKKHRLHMFAEQ